MNMNYHQGMAHYFPKGKKKKAEFIKVSVLSQGRDGQSSVLLSDGTIKRVATKLLIMQGHQYQLNLKNVLTFKKMSV